MDEQIIYCSECFLDVGLKLNAFKIGIESLEVCPHCNKTDGRKLALNMIERLSYEFFVKGSLSKVKYGAAPVIQFNNKQVTNIDVSADLKSDINLIEKALKVGFFYYGPRMWMVGEIEPLKALQDEVRFPEISKKIIQVYPVVIFTPQDHFYRLRNFSRSLEKSAEPAMDSEYDSPPNPGSGRFDDVDFPILYGSQDFEVCAHECRVSVEDELYMATLEPTRDLKLLNLTALLLEDNSEFESIDLAIQMLFYASSHSHTICRKLAKETSNSGFDGIVYPSYFSTVRTGAIPFETVLGISVRKLSLFNEYSNAQVIPNIALFGKPISENKVKVKCINRVVLNMVKYDIQFGPLTIQPKVDILEIKDRLQKAKRDLINEARKL